MRSNLMKQGLEKYPHRSLLKAMGLTDREIDQPIIGVANSFNEFIPGHLHLRQITEAAKAGVRMSGGTPLEFGVIGVCDGLAMHHQGMKYSLPSREIIADSIEIMATAHPVDGLVLVANCDKIIPGMLMAALRLNIPAILISGGPMLAGRFKGREVDLITVFEGVGAVKAGKICEDELKELAECACPGCGSCAGMFTANSMNCLSEALGLALPGNGTIPAVHAARYRLAKEAGFKIMNMVENQILPRQIATLEAFINAMAVDMALGCSTNTVLHVPAIAREADIDLSLDLFNKISSRTPHLCSLSPAGPHHMEDLDLAGGVPAVMKTLLEAGLVSGAPMSVTGQTVADNLAGIKVLDPEVIRPLSNPYHAQGGIAVLKGNLAPEGGVVKQSAVDEKMLVNEGSARVFDAEEEATRAILDGKIKPGDIVVLHQ
ncbi:MAG: dihydroxy-acid dehydratase, partial [Deltaproteobacteria bacterium]|nr:dihydroxy-acid dehydratase [Deltaproteobacteria bacterium]